MHFCSSHLYLVIIMVKRVKHFMFLFFLIRTNPVLFQISKMSGPSMDEINQTYIFFSSLPWLAVVLKHVFLSLLSVMAISTSEVLLICHFMSGSSSSLGLSISYPSVGAEMVYEVCILECTQYWTDVGSSASSTIGISMTSIKLFNRAETQFLIVTFNSDLLLSLFVHLADKNTMSAILNLSWKLSYLKIWLSPQWKQKSD